MIKTVFVLLSFLFLSYADLVQAELQGSAKARGAAFFPISKRIRGIYDRVQTSFQLEAATYFYENYEGWGNFDWLSKQGRSNLHNSTRLEIATISFGIKASYQFAEKWIPYLGIGPSFANVSVRNKSICSHGNDSKWSCGGVLKTGINYYMNDHLFIDLFADYAYQPISFKSNVDLGGFKLGTGVGYGF